MLVLGFLTLPILIVFGLAFKFYKFIRCIKYLPASKKRLKETDGYIINSIFCYSCNHLFYVSFPFIGETYSTTCPYCGKEHYI